MRHYFDNTVDITTITDSISAEMNNPLTRDLIRLARLWHTDKSGARKILSRDFDLRDNTGRVLIDVVYNVDKTYTEATTHIGRGCISNEILAARIVMTYSTIMNLASTHIEIEATNSVAMQQIMSIVSKTNYEESFRLLNNNTLVVSLKGISINKIMNILKSIEESYNTRRIQAVNYNW